ncbi:MAG: GWxTD domain-containing protein, partial [Acidobacteriota bacterium]|nr:GWxTD domain-containing protein [Acidobacteriota bacterium]
MNPKALAVIALTFAFAATILGQEAAPPKQQYEAVRKLSKRERRERMSRLDERHREFAQDVEPIMLPAELDLFLSLETAEDRDSFVDEFWRRRDAMNHSTGDKFKEIYARRLEFAKKQFHNASSDRAKMFLLHGAPAEVVRPSCPRVLQPIEIWKYPVLPGIGQSVRLIFFRPRAAGDYRLWNPSGGTAALADLAASNEALSSAEESATARRQRDAVGSQSPYAYINRIQLECGGDGNELMLAITQMVQARVDLLKLFTPPELDDEAVAKMMKSVVIANPNAPKLSAD